MCLCVCVGGGGAGWGGEGIVERGRGSERGRAHML